MKKVILMLAPLALLLSFAEVGYTKEKAFCIDGFDGDYAVTELGLVKNMTNVKLEQDTCYYGDLNGVIGKRLITVYAVMKLF